MTETAMLHNSLLVGGVLFALGLVGLTVRRNLIVMFLCAELMLQGVSLSLVAWGRFHNDWDGQILVVFVLTVAACEAGLALALFLMLFQRRGHLDAAAWQDLREANQPPHFDHEIPPVEDGPSNAWPQLTPAGVEPKRRPEDEMFRSGV